MKQLVNGITPRMPEHVVKAANSLKYRDFLTVVLILKDRNAFDDNWIYIHDPSVKVGRIQNFKTWSPEMVPDPSMTCYGLEYFCFEGDGLWNSPDADLIEQASRNSPRSAWPSPKTSSTAASCASRRRIPSTTTTTPSTWPPSARNWQATIRTCTWSAATACTSTTTRTTP